MSEGKKKRIQEWEATIMLVIAVTADLVSFIPVVGNIFAIVFGGGTLALWFMINGVGLISVRKVAVWGIGLIIEVIPAVSFLPGYTVGTLIMLALVRTEDATGISLPQPGKIGKKNTLSAVGTSPRAIAKGQRRLALSSTQRREVVGRARNIRRIRAKQGDLRERQPLRGFTPSPQES